MNYGTLRQRSRGRAADTIPGGASLWVFGNKSPEVYAGVAAFFDYLSQTDVQELHQTSGYLPVTMAAYEATKASGFYGANPGREQPIIQMMGKAPDRELARRPPRQPAAGPRHPERRVREDARRRADRASRARQRRHPRQRVDQPGARQLAACA
jgi:ABC-type glycerol-3-phosphate transport system substrate-binding protein